MKKKKSSKAKKASKRVQRAEQDSPLQKFVGSTYEVTKVLQANGVRLPSADDINLRTRVSQFEYVYNNVATQVKSIWGPVNGAEINSGDVALPVLMHLWKLGKVVYEFNPDFFDILSNSASTQVHVSVLKRIPHRNFLLYVPHENVIGYVVSLSFSGDSQVWISCARFDINDKDDVCGVCTCGCQTHWYRDGDEIIQKNNRYTTLWAHQNEQNSARDPIELQHDTLRSVFMACYYLAASNAELLAYKSGKAHGKYTRKNGTPVSVTEFQAGPPSIRYGKPFGKSEITKAEDESDATVHVISQHGNGTSPSPHMRRAHWHHYWTGPGREKLEVRWIEPVFVGGKESYSTVVHTVR